MSNKTTCPVCGTPCRIVGDNSVLGGTMHYEPITDYAELQAEIRYLQGVVSQYRGAKPSPLTREELVEVIQKAGIECLPDSTSPHPYYVYPDKIADAILKRMEER